MLRLRTVCLVAVALAAGGFFVGRMLVAQDKADKSDKGRQRGGFRGMSNAGLAKLDLLKKTDVQKDLELTDEEKTSIEKFSTDMHDQMTKLVEGLRGLSREDVRAKMQEIRPKIEEVEKDVQKKLDEVLTTPQRDRLAQIDLQAELQNRPLSVFSKKEVVANLELTDDQKEKLKDLRQSSYRGRGGRGAAGGRPAAGGPPAGGAPAGGPPSADARKKANEETLAKAKEILTSEQREKLDKMLGKKFEGDLSSPGFGGFGGRGRRNRGAGGAPSESTPAKPAEKTSDKPAEKTEAASPAK